MIILMIVSLVALVLLCDLCIYLRCIKYHVGRPLGIAYITQAVVLDVGILLGMLIAGLIVGDSYLMLTMVWTLFIFMMNFFAKFFCSFFLGLQWLLQIVFRKRRFRFVAFVGLTLALLVVGMMSYGAIYGRNELRVEYVDIFSDELPKEFDGFRIAQFSDTHIGNMGSRSELIKDLVKQINDQAPDIVVQSGDLVNLHAEELNAWYRAEFSKITAPVYAVLGNHDLGYYVSDTVKTPPLENVARLVAAQRDMGWTVLENEHRWLHRGGDSIAIAGVTFPNNVHHNGSNSIAGGSNLVQAMYGVPDSLFSVLISHTPSLFDSIPRVVRPDLTLSGHVHAMQIKFRVGSFSWSPARWLYPLYSGLYHDRGQQLYVNDGIGFVVYPMRLGTRPELTIFTLRTSAQCEYRDK